MVCVSLSFKKKGYSNEFTTHMGEIIQNLESNPTICSFTQTDMIYAMHVSKGLFMRRFLSLISEKRFTETANGTNFAILTLNNVPAT